MSKKTFPSRDDYALREWSRLFISHTVDQFILYQIH